MGSFDACCVGRVKFTKRLQNITLVAKGIGCSPPATTGEPRSWEARIHGDLQHGRTPDDQTRSMAKSDEILCF
jgi:hypothetical protein